MDSSLRVGSPGQTASSSKVCDKNKISQIDQDLYALFLDWKSKLPQQTANNSFNMVRINAIRAIQLESVESGVCAFKDVNNEIFAYGRLLPAEIQTFRKTNKKQKEEWDAAVSRAFASLTKYFEGECLRHLFPQAKYLSDRLLQNYASPDAAMQKLIETCRVIDIFAAKNGTLCIYLKDKQNFTPEIFAKCMMTAEEYAMFECDKLFRDFDELATFATSSNKPPYGRIGIVVRQNPDRVKELIAAIVAKFKDSDPQIRDAITGHYRQWPIVPNIIKYFEEAAAMPEVLIETLEIDRSQ